jgi:hypothetical protein
MPVIRVTLRLLKGCLAQVASFMRVQRWVPRNDPGAMLREPIAARTGDGKMYQVPHFLL